MVYWGLEGFVVVILFFNFIVIGGNLVGVLVLMGNVVLWKFSDIVMLVSYVVYCVFWEVGLFFNII